MSDYKIINLEEISKPSSGPVNMSFGRSMLESKDLGISLVKYAPNFKQDKGHHHREQEEAYVVVRGSGRILLNGQPADLKMWDVVRVAPSTVRAFEAGPDGLDLIAIGGPKPEGGDGTMKEVSWPE